MTTLGSRGSSSEAAPRKSCQHLQRDGVQEGNLGHHQSPDSSLSNRRKAHLDVFCHPRASSNFFLIGLSFSDRGQAWRLPSNIFKAPRWGTWTATRMALPLMSLICRFHGSRRQVDSHVVASQQVTFQVVVYLSKWWSPNRSSH